VNQPFDRRLRPTTVACALAATLTTTGIGAFIDLLAKPAGATQVTYQASAAPVMSVR
jgi:hypothetical protein